MEKPTTMEKVRIWMLNLDINAQISEDKNTGVISSRVRVQTKYAVNPFAGKFTENIGFVLTVTVEEKSVKYTMKDFILAKTYSGYGTNNKVYSLPDIITEIKTAKSNIESVNQSTELSKKEKKKQLAKIESIVKDNEESLLKAEQVISKAIENLEERLK
ncbi:MAG: hypothetical protein ACRC3G_07240 [Bacteroidales bacterium]